jgi:hypothetical protein
LEESKQTRSYFSEDQFFYINISFLNLFVKENFKNTTNSKLKVGMGQRFKNLSMTRGYLSPAEAFLKIKKFPQCRFLGNISLVEDFEWHRLPNHDYGKSDLDLGV